MTRRRRDELGLDIEEIDLDAWGNPAATGPTPTPHSPPTPRLGDSGWAAGPPTAPPTAASRPVDTGWTATADDGAATAGRRVVAWLRGHTKPVAAAVGALAVFATVVAIATGPGREPEAAPTTPPTTAAASRTERRPIATPTTTTAAPAANGSTPGGGAVVDEADEDFRFALAEVPEGFRVTEANVISPDTTWMPAAGATLFAADGATWDTGPWLMVLANRRDRGTVLSYQFSRPPTSVPIGPAAGRVGVAHGGLELTTFAVADTDVSVVARGVDPLTTVAVAETLTVVDGGASIPAEALPSGMRARPDLDVVRWEAGWRPTVRASVSYEDPERGIWLSITAGAVTDDGWIDSAGFFLSDLRYTLAGGDTGVAGRYRSGYGGDPPAWAIWQHNGHEYVAYSYGMDVDELLGHVGNVTQVGDDGWHDGRWAELREAATDCCSYPPAESTVYDEVAVASDDGEWTATIDVGPSVNWAITEDASNGAVFGLGLDATEGAPALRVDAAADWWGADQTFHVMAVVLVDRGMLGTRLQLTTTGSVGTTIAIDLAAVDGTPYLSAAAVLPWVDGGFVAQLVGPDGQVLAVQTDADLP